MPDEVNLVPLAREIARQWSATEYRRIALVEVFSNTGQFDGSPMISQHRGHILAGITRNLSGTIHYGSGGFYTTESDKALLVGLGWILEQPWASQFAPALFAMSADGRRTWAVPTDWDECKTDTTTETT